MYSESAEVPQWKLGISAKDAGWQQNWMTTLKSKKMSAFDALRRHVFSSISFLYFGGQSVKRHGRILE
jgi:hypothetical protein